MCHHARLIFVFLVEMGFYCVGQVGLELLTSGDPPASASQSAGITDVSHPTWPFLFFFKRQGVTLSLRLKYSGMVIVHYSLNLLSSSDPPASASQVADAAGVHHHARLIFSPIFLVEIGSCCVVQVVSNSWPPAILPLRHPKVLGFQA
uniref:Uncharacterized protein n=1 Tax=Macaca fascicularis TaxID=9541 RepID=A0A7N9D5S3_MACFA